MLSLSLCLSRCLITETRETTGMGSLLIHLSVPPLLLLRLLLPGMGVGDFPHTRAQGAPKSHSRRETTTSENCVRRVCLINQYTKVGTQQAFPRSRSLEAKVKTCMSNSVKWRVVALPRIMTSLPIVQQSLPYVRRWFFLSFLRSFFLCFFLSFFLPFFLSWGLGVAPPLSLSLSLSLSPSFLHPRFLFKGVAAMHAG